MNSPIPDTRKSLILRLPNRDDAEAWDEFTQIYQPLVYRLARSKGLQDADAQEVSQEVLVAVAGAVDRWKPDPQRGRFRDWLFRIARNWMLNYLTRKNYRSIASGNGDVDQWLQQQPDASTDQSAVLDLEYEREVLRWASVRVRQCVKDSTWKAFWMTSVEGRRAADVASELGISVGAVHIARSRVIGRLTNMVTRFELSHD